MSCNITCQVLFLVSIIYTHKDGCGIHLSLWMDQADSAFVDGNQKLFREIGLGRLFDFEESRTKRWPTVNNFQKVYLGVFGTHS